MIPFINPPGLQVLYSYNTYAAELLFDTLEKLSGDDFTRPSSPSHGTVQKLVLHVLDCEAFFLGACGGPALEAELEGLSSVPDLHAFSLRLAAAQQQFISSLTPEEALRTVPVRFKDPPLIFPVWQLLAQAAIHSTHHRGELSIVLTGLGHPLPTLDILLQFVQESGQSWD